VSSLVNALVCGVLSCCRCLCFRSLSLCPPLSKELHVGTIISFLDLPLDLDPDVRPLPSFVTAVKKTTGDIVRNVLLTGKALSI
jgi:hypothetical protein